MDCWRVRECVCFCAIKNTEDRIKITNVINQINEKIFIIRSSIAAADMQKIVFCSKFILRQADLTVAVTGFIFML